jgi:ABC-type nitrate/sulfonate/bicarbonate transport system ATPase subunit
VTAHNLALHHVSLDVQRRDNGRRIGMLRVLNDCNLEITAGEAVALVGPSGCSKSAVLDLFGGFGHPLRGTVLINGHPITGPHPAHGFVLPEYALFPWRTVLANAAFAIDHQLSDAERHARALSALELAGLGDRALAASAELGLADRRRVALARALAQRPGVLLLDEPYAGLAPDERRRFTADLARIRQRTGTTLVVATNDLPEAVRVAERVAVLTPRPARVAAMVDVTANPAGALGSVWTVMGEAEPAAA